MIRFVGERLIGEDQWIGRDDLPQIEVILDPVDVHILEDVREVLVRVDFSLCNIPQVRLHLCARKDSDTGRRSDETELLRVLALSRFQLEPA